MIEDFSVVLKDGKLTDDEIKLLDNGLIELLSNKLNLSAREAAEKFNLVFYDDKNHIEFDLKGDFDVVEKSDEGNRIIAGYASVAIVDDENQYIPPEVLEEGLKTLLDDESYANVMVVHKNIQIGKILKNYNDLFTHVDDKGLYIVAEIRKDLESAHGIWRKIVSGVMKGFSIGGEIIEKHNHCDKDTCYEIIDKINLFEVSVCSSPMNSPSGFEIIAKSNVSNECDDNSDKMTKKDIKPDQEDEDCEDCKEDAKKADDVEDKTEETKEEEEEEEPKTEEKSEDDPSELEKIIEKMDSLFTTMEKSITEQFEEIMKSMTEEDPVEEETKEKSDDEEETEEVEKSKEEEFEYAIKSRDDAIKGYEEKINKLESRVKELENMEEDPQTTSEEQEEIEKDSGLIIKHGRIYRK